MLWMTTSYWSIHFVILSYSCGSILSLSCILLNNDCNTVVSGIKVLPRFYLNFPLWMHWRVNMWWWGQTPNQQTALPKLTTAIPQQLYKYYLTSDHHGCTRGVRIPVPVWEAQSRRWQKRSCHIVTTLLLPHLKVSTRVMFLILFLIASYHLVLWTNIAVLCRMNMITQNSLDWVSGSNAFKWGRL